MSFHEPVNGRVRDVVGLTEGVPVDTSGVGKNLVAAVPALLLGTTPELIICRRFRDRATRYTADAQLSIVDFNSVSSGWH
jgi:hypothetical protein